MGKGVAKDNNFPPRLIENVAIFLVFSFENSFPDSHQYQGLM